MEKLAITHAWKSIFTHFSKNKPKTDNSAPNTSYKRLFNAFNGAEDKDKRPTYKITPETSREEIERLYPDAEKFHPQYVLPVKTDTKG